MERGVRLVVHQVLGPGLVAARPQHAEDLVGGVAPRAGHRELPGADAEGDHPRVDLEAQPVLQIVPGVQHTEGHLVGRPGGPMPQQPGRQRRDRWLPRVAVDLCPRVSQVLQCHVGRARRRRGPEPGHRLAGGASGSAITCSSSRVRVASTYS